MSWGRFARLKVVLQHDRSQMTETIFVFYLSFFILSLIPPSFIHSHSHSSLISLIHSLTHPSSLSFTHTHSFLISLIHSLTHPSPLSFTPIHPSSLSFTLSLIPHLSHSLSHSLTLSLIPHLSHSLSLIPHLSHSLPFIPHLSHSLKLSLIPHLSHSLTLSLIPHLSHSLSHSPFTSFIHSHSSLISHIHSHSCSFIYLFTFTLIHSILSFIFRFPLSLRSSPALSPSLSLLLPHLSSSSLSPSLPFTFSPFLSLLNSLIPPPHRSLNLSHPSHSFPNYLINSLIFSFPHSPVFSFSLKSNTHLLPHTSLTLFLSVSLSLSLSVSLSKLTSHTLSLIHTHTHTLSPPVPPTITAHKPT
uniref:Uncharacterized protein n=1 Tax=Octopus bimaculoides TaxID=37653 RepID=A0A0L8GR14_OCTBM